MINYHLQDHPHRHHQADHYRQADHDNDPHDKGDRARRVREVPGRPAAYHD